MKIINWLKGRATCRGKALNLYRRGMRKAKNQDANGAIEDYTSTIKLFGAPFDVVSMALFNRALIHVSNGEHAKGTLDLKSVLAMQGAPAKVKAMARQKLIRMKPRSE